MNLWFEGELQHIIPGDEPAGQASQLKKAPRFLKSNEETSFVIEKRQPFKSKEAVDLNNMAPLEGSVVTGNSLFIGCLNLI